MKSHSNTGRVSGSSLVNGEHSDERLPFISIVIPALNEETFIQSTIYRLLEQEYPQDRMEILVIDGGSTDSTCARVNEVIRDDESRVRLFHNPNRLSSYARNIGVNRSVGDYVLFIDAHVFIPSRRVIHDMALAAQQNGALVLGRAQPLNSPNLNVVQASIAAVRASPIGHSSESYIYSSHEGWVNPFSVGTMYCRTLFDLYGLFDESFDAAEDLEFNYRLEKAGIEAYMSPRFLIYYYPRQTFGSLFRQMQRYGMGRIRFARKHPERSRLENFAPFAFALAILLVLLFLLSVEDGRFALTLIPVIGVSTVILGLLSRIKRSRFVPVLMAPFCLCVIHFGLAWGVMRELFRGRVGLNRLDSLLARSSRYDQQGQGPE